WAWNVSLEVYRELSDPPALIDFVWNWRAMWLPLLRLMRTQLPEGDVLHAPSTGYAGWLGGLYHRLAQKPLVVTEHGIYTREREEEIVRADWVPLSLKGWWNDFFAYLGRVSYDEARIVTTLSEINQRAQLAFGAERAKMRLIPNGVNPERYAHIEPAFDRSQGTPFVVGAIIRVVPIKDIKTMLRAMAVVLRHLPDSQLMLIGPQEEDPDYFAECVALIESLGIRESVVWTGAVDILEYLPKLHCLMLTSISEGQPLVMLEAMAAGLPLVVTDVGGCRELIEGIGDDALGDCGFVTPLMTPTATAERLLDLAADPALCLQMGQIGRERVREKYRLEQVMKAYRDLYDEAVRM
ncbi:MAG: GT4 family glycosyltransferase PelF, partial [Tumebacillaceae bacterium]